ncbi:hypothetical protein [Blastococcus sp. Marseille-P5729]|uniref:hypothetical protein n=1 Tax=Blastococcus sp. Marseille-P5729 TaxID=2086582 RepID=UPI000D107BE5|nr:hypothetical protein [Blastococcus sp. Marseille-P5729]
MSTPQPSRRSMSSRDWAMFIAAFLGAFLLSLGFTRESTGAKILLILLGILMLAVAAGILLSELRDRSAEAAERESWESFEDSLEEGVRFDVPDGMGYAAELPPVLDDLRDAGEPADGQARHAIVGERGEIHWCAFQHVRGEGAVATIGLVGLHPDRDADSYPLLSVEVADPNAEGFDERFTVQAEDPGFAEQVLSEQTRAELMEHIPFDWQLAGNQIITRVDRASSPEEQVRFIEERVEPLARIAARIPLDA